jgi:hypothetical protein
LHRWEGWGPAAGYYGILEQLQLQLRDDEVRGQVPTWSRKAACRQRQPMGRQRKLPESRYRPPVVRCGARCLDQKRSLMWRVFRTSGMAVAGKVCQILADERGRTLWPEAIVRITVSPGVTSAAVTP